MRQGKFFLDSLYGDVTLDEDLDALVLTPMVQRLRHVRLSNIDSVTMPGIGNISRYEHVLGVGHLAVRTGLYKRLGRRERLAFAAAAILHDWAITAFGHLVEEAFQYLGVKFDHENKLYEMIVGSDERDIGGADKQIMYGRQMKLKWWLQKVVAVGETEEVLREITNYIQGRGRFGRVICGDIDLDNIDGVFRMAYHMGLAVDRECPLRLAGAIAEVREDGEPVFVRDAEDDLDRWVETRFTVYSRLMLAKLDFIGKLMILFAAVTAVEKGEIDAGEWDLTDCQLLDRLLSSPTKEVRDATTRWLVGEFWDATPLYWMHGVRPEFERVLGFSRKLTAVLGRPCFAYAIKDKRKRLLNIEFMDGTRREYGAVSSQWLLGVGSAARRPFKAFETSEVVSVAEAHFGTSVISPAGDGRSSYGERKEEGCLL